MLSKLNLNNDEINFKDSGCRFSSSCLSCPIEICIYDDPSFVRNLEKNNRYRNIIEDRSKGLSNKQIAEKYNISVRTVHRALKKIKPKKSINLDFKNNIYKKFEIYSSRSWSIKDDESPVKTYKVLSAIFVDLSEILSKLCATQIM